MVDPDPDGAHGHRQRLRDRFLDAGADALADYELLELLLGLAIPRQDVKPLAKELIRQFGSFAGVINAEPPALTAIPGVKRTTLAALKIVQASVHRILRAQVRQQPVLANWQSVVDYCRGLMAHRKIEEFRLLFLDSKHALIVDELRATGTIDHAPVYPREVAKRALEVSAASVIMAHNHPSGDPTPSRADIEMTREVAKALASLGIQLHDHLVIGRDRHNSLKAMGLF